MFAGKAHPFATLAGRTTNDEAHLSALREAARLWNEPDFWQHAELDAGMIRFDEEKIGISALSSMILHDAIREKIEASAMQLDQLPSLLPHLRKFGWPGDSVSTMPVRVAFRLTEPDADSDTEWLLETVVVSERGAHWTPAVRKANADISDALPAKWKAYADEIREKQSEMVSFLRSVEAEPGNRFLSVVDDGSRGAGVHPGRSARVPVVRLFRHLAGMAEVGDGVEDARPDKCERAVLPVCGGP